MPRFEFVSGKSDKYWDIRHQGTSLTINFGRTGTIGKTQEIKFSSKKVAESAYNKLIAQKLKKGYVEAKTKSTKSKASLKPDAVNSAMTTKEFWKLIDRSQRAATNNYEQADLLKVMLMQLTPEEILAFDYHLQLANRDALRWDLWAAAYIMRGGCSDDGFHYFLGWLIAQGQKYFEAALVDPNNAGNKAKPGADVECEGIWYVAAKAYKKITGKKDFHKRVASVPFSEVKGRAWDDETVHKVVPRLAKKFDWHP